MDALRRAAGRTILVGLPGPELDEATVQRLQKAGFAGVILFARNLETPAQTAELLRRVAGVLPHPPLLSVDQEGGRVSRLEPWIGATPPAAELAEMGIEALTDFGITTGNLLASLGFNLDFAPVVDLSPKDSPNGVGDRAFSTDPDATSSAAGAFLTGLQSTGVAGCLKHFPGLGDTSVDSHLELPCVSRTAEQLDALIQLALLHAQCRQDPGEDQRVAVAVAQHPLATCQGLGDQGLEIGHLGDPHPRHDQVGRGAQGGDVLRSKSLGQPHKSALVNGLRLRDLAALDFSRVKCLNQNFSGAFG